MAKQTLSANELETALDSISEGAFIINTEGKIIRANRAALKLLGFRRNELVGEALISKLVALSSESQIVKTINRPSIRAIVTGVPSSGYHYYQRKDKTKLPIFVSTAPIIKDYQPIGIIQIFRDVSLEEAVDKMRSEFLSLASHQLRTPLASIKTYSHMLLDGYMGEIDSQKRPALEVIVGATNRMNELISTLLSIARLESGTIVFQMKTIDLAVIIKDIIKEMEVPAKNRSIVFRLKIPEPSQTKIKSDGPIVKEILTNLISNSVKYSEEGGQITISISAYEDSVNVIVKDRGLGIPLSAKSQIFSKFYRAPNVIEPESSGTGLGLYLTKGLVDELGGQISFRSKEGRGTTFTIKFPKHYAIKK